MRVLIIEDDPHYADLVARALDGLAKPAVIVSDWEQAEEYLDKKDPEGSTEVAWIDLRMPTSTEEESVERITALRARHQDLVIIVASGFLSDDIKSKLSGVDGFLAKDRFNPKQVASLIVLGILRSNKRLHRAGGELLNCALVWLHERYPGTTIPTESTQT